MKTVNRGPASTGDILIVDDTLSDLKLLSDILRKAGYTVRTARDSELALRNVKARLPDLILLDVAMPGLNGYEVCRRLKDSKDTLDIPVIFVSVAPGTKETVKAFSVGGVDYITKPFEPEEILARIATHMSLWKAQMKIVQKNLQLKQEITGRKHAEAEREKLQDQLNHAQKMESIGIFAGDIAHDLNNILVPIMGFSQILLDETSKNSPVHKDLNVIHNAALRAKDLVQQILAFVRQSHNEPILMKMQPVIKEALKLLKSTIPTTIAIKEDIHPDCGVIKADPTQIHQIVMNLATNAYHAMEEAGGVLKVILKEIEFEKDDLINQEIKTGSYVCLTIADTGKGMDKELIQKIFEPFFTTKTVGKGTGMGLSVVHGIVAEMHGDIQVESEPGKGTQFHVYLPVEKSRSNQLADDTKIPIQTGSERILLVDDEDSFLKMGKRMLEQLGYHVITSSGSTEALEVFRVAPDKFDMVITDMTMPDMTGDELSVELIKIRSDIPILLCTGFSKKISEKKAASLGIKGFTLKPFGIEDFSKKIRKVLDK